MPALYFDSSTNLKDLIGRRLVTNKISAIFELVKNSFDADAEQVRVEFKDDGDTLVISDNGVGMSLKDIETKWMVVGTDNKKDQEYTKNGRPLNGEKGIGRFSVDRLGKRLVMISSTGLSNPAVHLTVNWEDFEDRHDMKLSEIPVQYSFLTERRKKGVKLIIKGLRDAWSEKEVLNLEKKLRGLLSPFSDLDNYPFRILLHNEKFGYREKVLTPYRLDDISSLWINMEIPEENTDIIRYTLYRNGADLETEEYPNPYKFGPAQMVLYSFDKGDKISFSTKFGENVKDFGSIRIYRDYFQIYPYGEPGNDWAGLEERKSQGHFRHLGVRDLVGYIQISRANNKNLVDATNRQGLEENEAHEELRQFIRKEAIPILEEYFFLKKNKTAEKEHTQHREDITNATKDLWTIAKEIKKSHPVEAKQVLELSTFIREKSKQQDRIIRDQQQMVEVYKRLSSKGTLLQGIIHQVLIKLQSIEAAIYNQREDITHYTLPNELVTKLHETQNDILAVSKYITESMLGARTYLLRKRERVTLNVSQHLNNVFREHKHDFDANEIKFTVTGNQSINMKIDVNDFKTIFDNLISNSKKSLVKVTDRDRVIEVRFEVNGTKINFFFKDNGIGIDKLIATKIFNPFFTTNTDGFGMGLPIVDELVKMNKGEIDLIIPKKDELGASFQITFNLED